MKKRSKAVSKCKCGNPEFGFACTCEFERQNPGTRNFTCEFCGIYQAGKPRCNFCEEELPASDVTLLQKTASSVAR